ncbi:oxygen-independent coproporphyrinogen III oxidase (plasmid) [Sinorhizobium garamanticum]|uniref:Coproporphyrinogen-III oxidase n=1 Tax=Sinorhizobium garamanticum TaxID=680247 RepID=A0ABY8DLE8_9HYPH|nr:oxygen-independent coproporphyrinogen III oxidase [Sinorhizobium garamanticum]WEX91731.1 oxygen-independent coproporphyrinogen III oxidase [Sinorhizobium garamanticum]
MQPDLVAKYGEARLPRYTSYPTAPRFSPTIDAGTYGGWLAATPAEKPVSLYLHIPFCRSMCWYCGCHTTITQRDQPILDYLDMLREEVRLVSVAARKNLAVDHVHFGGGTPTIMKPQEFHDLIRVLRDRFGFTKDAEIAVEIDPRTLEREMAKALGEAGVRRASLGVQSFDSVVQKAINRNQSEEQTMEAVARLRRAGVDSINFDLVYGLPHQTVQSCVNTAEAAIAMRPDRFAVFGYAHVPSFKKHQMLIDETALADAEGRIVQAEAIAATLVAAGYRRIGLDHFARADDSLAVAQAVGQLHRNFQGYTTDACDTLIGFGASAIGRTTKGYAQNEVPPGLYAQKIAAGRLATMKGYRLTEEDRLRAAIIERLMCDFSADIPAIAAAHGFDPGIVLENNARLVMLEGDGILENTAGVIRLCEEGRFLIRAVAAAFDAYLDQSARTHSKSA